MLSSAKQLIIYFWKSQLNDVKSLLRVLKMQFSYKEREKKRNEKFMRICIEKMFFFYCFMNMCKLEMENIHS